MRSTFRKLFFLVFVFSAFSLCVAAEDNVKVLFDFDKDFDVNSVQRSDCSVSVSGGGLVVETGHEKPWPGITLKAPGGKWDLTGFREVMVEVSNPDDKAVTVNCRVDNPGADGVKNCVTNNVTIGAGERAELIVSLYETQIALSEPLELIGMRGTPGLGRIDTGNVTQFIIFVSRPDEDHKFRIDKISAAGKVVVLDAKIFTPFIDEFGQFIHADWPGKLKSADEFEKRLKAEQNELAERSSPKDWNKFGGWAGGPKLKATGFFRVEKYKDKWWLVDPEGGLFFSHGVDCVHPSTSTPISGRENYFKALPEKDSPLGQFYGRGSWAPHGYYKDHSPYETYDLFKANLLRKYGDGWFDKFSDITHRRLRSWGLNTIANWSDSNIYLMRRTPYTATVGFSSRNIEGSEGYWGKFPDPFDTSFVENLRRSLERQKDASANDPWCIGYFVHNELGWGDELSLAAAALMSPADQPAKMAFIEALKEKYSTIDKLNEAWGTEYSSWAGLVESTDKPDVKLAREDLADFYTVIAEKYFKTIREEIKAVAPNQLYMGCRFAWVNDRAAHAAAKYCDIVCYNRYYYSVADLALSGDIDKPIIIGEFHFGALDRGMFHTGLKPTKNQNDRAAKYKSYVLGALGNRYIVGTHWFQCKDQATTGRGDGENYQIGFVDITDTPYPETIAVLREVGYDMYRYRLNN